jgi:hypothetical protein
LRNKRCLLILDQVDAVLCGNELGGAYRPGYEGYGWLLQQLGLGQHRSAVLLTSREIPVEIAIQEGDPLRSDRKLEWRWLRSASPDFRVYERTID